jgi:hypothetical protein
MDRTGYNINNYINVNDLVTDFISHYIVSSFQDLINTGIVKEYTVFNLNGNIFNRDNICELIDYFNNIVINVNNTLCLDSGSRRIDIVFSGYYDIYENNVIVNQQNFTQSMTICHLSNNWFIKNSIILFT